MRFEPDKPRPFLKQTRDQENKGLVSIIQLRNRKFYGKERDKHLHSREHLLADDISRDMRELKKFSAYLGIAKLYYESDLRALAKYVLQKNDLPVEARGKYFFAALKGLEKKPGVKFKNLRRKEKKKSKNKKARKSRQNITA